MVKRFMLVVLAGAFCIAALGGIYAFVFGSFSDIQIRIMITSLSLTVFSLTGLSCAVWIEKKKLLPLAYSGITVSGLTWLIIVWLIWKLSEHPAHRMEALARLGAMGVVLSLSLAYSSLLLTQRAAAGFVDNIIYFTLGCLSVVAIMQFWLIWFFWFVQPPQSQFWRVLGVFAILTVLGTVLAPLVRQLQGVPLRRRQMTDE